VNLSNENNHPNLGRFGVLLTKAKHDQEILGKRQRLVDRFMMTGIFVLPYFVSMVACIYVFDLKIEDTNLWVVLAFVTFSLLVYFVSLWVTVFFLSLIFKKETINRIIHTSKYINVPYISRWVWSNPMEFIFSELLRDEDE